MQKFITKSENETLKLGKNLARKFRNGKTIGLIGQLGAGKTILIKGMAQGLGVKKTITSPTFVLMKVYPVKNKKSKISADLLKTNRISNGVYPVKSPQIKHFVHLDAYRLKSGQDLIDIGLKDWLERPDVVTVIEWADRVGDILPKNAIIIKLKLGKKKNERIIKIYESTNPLRIYE